MLFHNLGWFSKWRIHQPWELASERWCASPNIQPHEMSCRASGHHWSNVWTHEAWKCRLVCVAKRLFNIYDIFCPYTSLTVPLKPCQLCALRTWKGTTIFLAHNLMELKEFGKKHRLDSVVILKRLSPKYCWVFNCQEATDEAVILWAKRVQSYYNRKAPRNASSKQKAFGLLKLGGWFLSKISKWCIFQIFQVLHS